ncbi:hypothetical protein J6590_043433 [Homalodisca vitripennis]|nr:hypothetical protein J6590_043433 [Homalodisca vitripennis]
MSVKEFAEEVVITSILTDEEVIHIFSAFATGKPHGLQSISAETKRLPFSFVVKFTKDSTSTKYDVVSKHTIKVNDKNLILYSIELRQDIPNVDVCLQQDNKIVCSNVGYAKNKTNVVLLGCNALKAHNNYDLIITRMENDGLKSMKLWDCTTQYSDDFCSITEHSSCIKRLTFFVTSG